MKRVLLMLLPLFLCGAASFNGFQGASTTASVSYGTNVITVSYYIRHDATNSVVVALESSANAGSANYCWYATRETPNNAEAWLMRGTSASTWGSPTPAPLGVLVHRVVVFNNSATPGSLTVYDNGQHISSLTRPYPANVNTGTAGAFSAQVLNVGARNKTSLRFTGLVQDLAIYAGEVSAAEAYSLGAQRMSPLKVRSAKLLYYWPFSAGENASNTPDLVGGIPVNSGTKSITTEQAPTFRK